MATAYSLTPELRIKLKKPIGTLIRGSFAETMKTFKDMTEKEKPPVIISVGDTVSRNLAEKHVLPQLSIVDNRVMRRNIEAIPLTAEKTIHIKNPPGTITEEALGAIQDALKSNCHVKIVVDGEEDLLTLIAVLYAPENSFVIYGQPREGVVVVKATNEKKTEVAVILKAMENVRKAK
jgi:hypothetical protein